MCAEFARAQIILPPLFGGSSLRRTRGCIVVGTPPSSGLCRIVGCPLRTVIALPCGGTLLLRITLLRVAAIIGLLLLCVVSLLRVPAGAVALLRVAVAALRVVSSMGGAIGAVSAAKCRLLRGHRGVHLSMCACQLVVALLQTTARGCSV